jgi:hypothetical protein
MASTMIGFVWIEREPQFAPREERLAAVPG